MAARVRAPGFYRAGVMMVGAVGLATLLTWGGARVHGPFDLSAFRAGERDPHGVAARGAARLPRRHRRLRLLVLLGAGEKDAAGGPLGTRRVHLEGLLPDQHRPQGDRRAVHRHLLLLPARRRAHRDADARRAGAAGRPVRGLEHLQRPLLGPRLAADLPLHHPRLRGPRELRAAADDRRAGHGLPALERALLLAAAGGRRDDAGELLRSGRRVRRRLDGLRAAVHQRPDRTDLLLGGRPVRRAPPRS